MILNKEQYSAVSDKVYELLQFSPTIDAAVVPFVIAAPHVVFDVSGTEEQIDEQSITNAFINCLLPDEKMYALDWQHSAFLFDPRETRQMESVYVEDSRYPGGGYYADFPPYYPDGDYYFFIDEQFRFGYLGHPWRQEVWIFGDCLIAEIEALYRRFGWTVKEV